MLIRIPVLNLKDEIQMAVKEAECRDGRLAGDLAGFYVGFPRTAQLFMEFAVINYIPSYI